MKAVMPRAGRTSSVPNAERLETPCIRKDARWRQARLHPAIDQRAGLVPHPEHYDAGVHPCSRMPRNSAASDEIPATPPQTANPTVERLCVWAQALSPARATTAILTMRVMP